MSVLLVLFAVMVGGCDNGPFSTQTADVPDPVPVSPDDPYFTDSSNSQWYLDTINAPGAWALYEATAGVSYAGRDLQPVVVSVVDSGIVAGHEDLAAVLATDSMYFVGGAALATPEGISAVDARAGHGTHVAGLIAAQGANGHGIAGATYNGWPGPMFRLRSVTVLDYDPFTGRTSGTVADVVAGMTYAVGADSDRTPGATRFSAVMNMSLGAAALASAEALLFENALTVAGAADVLLVAAAGNDGSSGVDFPARFPGVVAVGSVDADLTRSFFSDYGPQLELVAPGAETSNGSGATGILSTYAPSGHARSAGTSMATPLVAAAAAIVRSANPYLSAAETRQILRETARDLGDPGWDEEYGYGLVDMEAALRRALSEPYGRFSSSSNVPGAGAVTPQVLSAERRAEYDQARAETDWDSAGLSRVSVLVRAGGNVDAVAALPGVRRVGQTALPDGTLLRAELTTGAAASFDQLKTHPDVLLVHQERRVEFSSADFLQSPDR